MNTEAQVQDIYPLSPMQQGMLFHTLVSPDSGIYVWQMSCRLAGQLDCGDLRRAWERVIERHALLRTSFVWEGLDQPVQVVESEVPLPLEEEDWSGLSEPERRRRLETYLAQDLTRGFDPEQPPLMRLLLVREGAESHRLVWSTHMALLDGWSMATVMREVFLCYEAFHERREPSLEAPRPFRDYVAWLAGRSSDGAETFWHRELGGFTSPTPLPGDRGGHGAAPPVPAELRVHLSEEETAALQAVARESQLTLSTLLQGAWALLLARTSGQDDVVFGVTVSGRPPELVGVESMVGVFINTLPLRAAHTPEGCLLEWLRLLQARQVEARQLEHTPLIDIRSWSDVPRGLPLFESIVVFENYPVDSATSGSPGVLRLEETRVTEIVNYPLMLQAMPGPRLRLGLMYDRSRFDEPAVARIAGWLRTLLGAMPAGVVGPVRDIPHLSAAERHQLLVEWNDTAASCPPPLCLPALFVAQAARTPHLQAVACGGRTLTYGDLDLRSNRLAHALQGLGCGAGATVGVLMKRSVEMVVAVLGVLKAGAAYLPLDPRYPRERLARMLTDSAAPLLLTQERSLAALPLRGTRVLCLEEGWEGEAEESGAPRWDLPGEQDLAYVIYTSGSTGQPKGVEVHHGALVNLLRFMAERPGLAAGDRLLAVTSLSFDIAALEIFLPLIVGASVEIVGSDVAADGARLLASLCASDATVMQATPSTWRLLLDSGWQPGGRLRVLSGGEAMTRDLARRLLERTSATWNGYGPTETTIYSVLEEVLEPGDRPVPIGRPIANTRIHLLDTTGEPVPIGVPGELCIGGTGVARGYRNLPSLTAERFIPEPSGPPGGRLYRTGDLARWLPDGSLDFLGRLDHQVKVRGFRIELGEVEAALARHPAVREAVVVAHRDAGTDRESVAQILVAYVVPAEGSAARAGELRQFLAGTLPEHMVPSLFEFLDALPLTPNRKMDRRALPSPQRRVESVFRAPRSPVEEVLVEIWRELLEVERVGIHDSFFDLGGHSLLATRLASRVRATLGAELPLRALFDAPTVARLAQVIEASLTGRAPAGPALVRAPRGRSLPLSFAQERFWFLDQLLASGSAYHIFSAWRLRGPLDVSALGASLREVVRRHEILRTSFPEETGVPRQRIALPPAAVPLPVIDLCGQAGAWEEAQRLAAEERERPFDLAHGPLIRLVLVLLGPEEHLALLNLHHIVSDGWSANLLFAELAALYNASSRGRVAALPELPVQYADYATWQREQLSGGALKEHLSWWTARLAGLPPRLDLPYDQTPRPGSGRSGARWTELIPADLVKAARAFGNEHGATLFMTLLTALDIVLFRWTGQTDLVVGTVVGTRDRAELEGLIGCFTNFLPLRVPIPAEGTGLEALERVRSHVLESYAHRDCPFEKVVTALLPDRDLDGNPIYNVALLLQNFARATTFSETLEAELEIFGNKTALLDLRLVAEEVMEGLRLDWEYRPDLFAEETVRLVAEAFHATLHELVRRPRTPLPRFPLPAALAEQAARTRARERWGTVAVAATFTAEPVAEPLLFWLRQLDLGSRVELAPYNQVFQQLLDPGSLLSGNSEGVNAVLVRCEDWLRYPGEGDARERLGRGARDLVDAFRTAAGRDAAPCLAVFCPPSPAALTDDGLAVFLKGLEEELTAELGALPGVHLIPSADLTAGCPEDAIHDPGADEIGHVPYTPLFFTALGTSLARRLYALRSRPRKVIALDCDQTLWRGVCGEDGPLKIEIDPPHRALQELMRAQHEAGMLLCLCSKNAEQDVLQVFAERSDMPLALEHVVSWRINWEPKSDNLRALATELGLGLDSFVLIDDDPVQCASVRAACPEVLVLQLPDDPGRIPGFLQSVWAFDRLRVTEEDRRRTALYQQNVERERLRERSPSLEEFLRGLELEVHISPLSAGQLERVSQLTGRTNQLNTTTIRRSAAEVEGLGRGGRECLVTRVRDRFGDYGLVGVLVLAAGGETLQVDSFLLSCRVLGRGVEHRMLAHVGALARERGLDWVDIDFAPTDRNRPALDFLRSAARRIAGAQEGERGFRFPASGAAELIYAPDTDPPAPAGGDAEERPASPARGASAELESALFQRFGGDLYGLERVHEAVEREQRRKWRGPGEPFVAPQGAIEELLAGVFAEVLRVDRVGAHDDFFRLGGHSLLATQLLSRVRATLGVELDLRALFEQPTVAGLARRVERSTQAAAPPITPLPRPQEIPLSFAQQRLWFLDQLEVSGAAYNVPLALRVAGPLDLTALAEALRRVAARHETLRTTFTAVGGHPVQVISPVAVFPLAVEDLSPLPESEREEEAERRILAEASRPFDLARGPLARGLDLRLGDQDHWIVLTLHHIVSDGWSLGVLLRELGESYAEIAAGRPSSLPELPVQYADFALWQRDLLSGERLEAQIAWWREQLAGAAPVLELPTDHSRPADQTFHGAVRELALPGPLAESLEALAQRCDATLFMVLLAAFRVLLHRYTGQEDVVVGSPIANRNRVEIEPLIGFFVNTLALRGRLAGEPGFRELVGREREVMLGAYAHQDLPFEKLVEELHPERNLGHTPLFQVMFILQNAPVPDLDLPGLSLRARALDLGTAKLDLTLSLARTATGLTARLEHNTDLFETPRIDRMLGHYGTLLSAAVDDPRRPVGDLPLLSAEELSQLLAGEETGKKPPASGLCLHRLFEEQAARTPERTALVAGEARLTYREIGERAARLAERLRKHGVGPEVRVAVCAERSPELVIGLLAVLRAGGAYVPLDPAYPAERLAWMLEDSGALVLLTQESLAKALPASGAQLVLLDGNPDEEPGRAGDAAPGNAAYVIYTSGSTGRPKGVVIEHRGAVALIDWARRFFMPEELDGVLFSTSICFDLSVFELFAPLAVGGKVILAGNALDLHELPAAAEVTLVNTVPSAMAELIRQRPLPAGVRAVGLAGEPLPGSLARSLYERSSVRRVLNLYGPSEDSTYSTAAVVPGESAAPPSIGRPIEGTRAYLLDAYLRPVPEGVPGEICLGGAGLARGYLGRPHLTAERFVPDPFARQPGERLYRTGDLAVRRPGGDLGFLGRIDHQVKVRGFRIELGEIEEALLRHPKITAAVVVAWGDLTERRLVAYVTAAPESPSPGELRAHLRDALPEPMVPSAFLVLNSLPRTPNGKVDRRVLPAPDSARPALEKKFVAPRNAVEEVLSGLWAEVLGLERMGIHDDFFDLGGHSLLATQVVSRISETLCPELRLRHFFATPTVAGLAEALLQDPERRERTEKVATLLMSLASMSEDEAAALLDENV